MERQLKKYICPIIFLMATGLMIVIALGIHTPTIEGLAYLNLGIILLLVLQKPNLNR